MANFECYILCLCDAYGNFHDECIYHSQTAAMDDIAARGLTIAACSPSIGFTGTLALVMYAVDVPTIDIAE